MPLATTRTILQWSRRLRIRPVWRAPRRTADPILMLHFSAITVNFAAASQFETSRLRLFPCTSEWQDIADKAAQDPRVAQSYFLHAPPSNSHQHAPGSLNCTAQHHQFVAVTKLGEEFVGAVKIINNTLSFYLSPPFWGQGLGKEMVQAVFDHVMRSYTAGEIEALLLRRNVASKRIVESLGFRFCGIERERNRNGFTFDEYLHYRL